MKTSIFLSSVFLALGVSASPVIKRAPTSLASASASATESGSLSSATISSSAAASTPTGSSSNGTSTPAARALNDTQILQFALTLEHLESAFYNASISLLSDEDFQNAGYNATTRDQLYSIGLDEQAHVQFLTAALGNNSVSPCEYDLSSVTDVKSFLATAQVLEGVGVSAYLGAAKLILDKTYLEAAGSILTVESRHQSYINSQVNSTGNAIPAAFDTPLNATEVYSLAAPFIKSCPQNSTLPFKAFPAATIALASSSASNATSGSNSTQTNSTTPEVNASNSTGSANSTSASITPGSQVAITYEKTMAQSQDGNNASTVYVAIISGPTAPTFVELPESGIITLPANITGGQFYAVVTSSNETVSDDTALAIGAGQVLVPLPKAPAATASQSASSSSATASETSTDAASSATSGISGVASSGASSATASSASVTSGVSASATSGVASLSSSVVPTPSA